jgi:adhesin transport system outer membrane protein
VVKHALPIISSARLCVRPHGRIGLSVLAVSIAWLVAPLASAESLEELLRLTRDHPAVAAAEAEAGAARADVTVAEAAKKLHVSAGLGAAGYSSEMNADNQWASPYISASKLLYDHGRTDARVEGRNAALAAREQGVRLQRERINKEVVQLYVTALTHSAIGSVLEEQEAALEELLDKVRAIVSVDPGRASEANQVESRLASVRASRHSRATSEKEALQQISQILEKSVSSVSELSDLEYNGLLPSSLIQARNSLESHPELEIARYGRDESDAAHRLATKWRKPTWNVDLRVDSPTDVVSGDPQLFQGVTLQVSSDLSLFDGGAGYASAQGAAQRVQAAEAGIDNVRRNLRQELERLWAGLPLRKKQLEAQQDVVDAAERIRQAGEEQFFAGRRPLIDLMSFDSEYFNSQIAYQEQKVQYLASQWLMVAALGKLSDVAQAGTRYSAGRRGTPSSGIVPATLTSPLPWPAGKATNRIDHKLDSSGPELAVSAPEATQGDGSSTVRLPQTTELAPGGTDPTYLNSLRSWGGEERGAEESRGTLRPTESTDDTELRQWPLTS